MTQLHVLRTTSAPTLKGMNCANRLVEIASGTTVNASKTIRLHIRATQNHFEPTSLSRRRAPRGICIQNALARR